jgi:hypothetical protein
MFSTSINFTCVRKTGPRSNKIKQMWKQNTKDTQYKRETELHGSPSVGYVHQRNCQVLSLLLSSKMKGYNLQKNPMYLPLLSLTFSSLRILYSPTYIAAIQFPHKRGLPFREKNPNIISIVRSATL